MASEPKRLGTAALRAQAARAAEARPGRPVGGPVGAPAAAAEGERARARGAELLKECPRVRFARRLGRLAVGVPWGPRGPSRALLEKDMGAGEGRAADGLAVLFATHYARMFADPRMAVLFDTRHADSNASALEHGTRLAATLMDLWYGTREYASLGRGSSFRNVGRAHARAKRCPLRPNSGTGAPRFSEAQRDAWLGHVLIACEECGASAELQHQIGRFLGSRVNAYGPFRVRDDESKLP